MTLRNNGLILFAIVVLAAGAAACGGGGGDGGAVSSEVAEGHKLFKGTCAMCHGPNGEGMERLGKDLRDNEFTQKLSDEELVAFLKEGRPAAHPLNERGVDMPPNGGNPTLSEADLALIVAYMRTLQ